MKKINLLPIISILIVCGLFAFTNNDNNKIFRNTTLNQRPNIIIFMADDFGYDLPSYTGNESFETPYLDFMAANGMQFTNCYSHPDGYPSRLALQTGKYNHSNYTFWGKLPYGEKTLGNLLQDAGYATMYLGRWSFDGGDTMIGKAGFEDYLVNIPFANNEEVDDIYRHLYKDPWLYHNGFVDTLKYKGLYSEDLYFEKFEKFVDSSGQKPFFIMYANNLPREPLVPSPLHPDFESFDVDTTSDSKNEIYFPSMITYLDNTVGKVIHKLEEEGIAENTIIIFLGDNATDRSRSFVYKGNTTNGKKNQTYKLGIQAPLTIYWPGTIKQNGICKELISYTDFVPTISEIVGLPIPPSYGTIHGNSFFHNLFNISGTNREWNYIYWDNSPNDTKQPIRFIHDTYYKLYKDTFGVKTFYKIDTDRKEATPLLSENLTPEEIVKYNRFEFVIDSLWATRYQ